MARSLTFGRSALINFLLVRPYAQRGPWREFSSFDGSESTAGGSG
jgi:hypothetical protein